MSLLINEMRALAGLATHVQIEPITLAIIRGGVREYANPRMATFPGHPTPNARWTEVDETSAPLLRADGSYGVADADQGLNPNGRAQLGNCWLAAPLQADRKHAASLLEETDTRWIAHFPDETVAVRKSLLTTEDGKLPYIGRVPDGTELEALAPAVLEKAIAARQGSYGHLHGGYSDWAFELLHGRAPQALTWSDTTPSRVALEAVTNLEPVTIGTTLFRRMSAGAQQILEGHHMSAEHTYWVDRVSRDAAGNELLHLVNPRLSERQPLPLTATELDAVATEASTPSVGLRSSARTPELQATLQRELGVSPRVPDRSDDPGFH